MDIYYNSSLWNMEKQGSCGLPQETNWQFEYAGTKRYIPVVYRFSQEIVFDIVTILDEIKISQFLAKYKTIEDMLTPLQQRCLEQEHPYQTVPIEEVWINERQTENGYSFSDAIIVPWQRQDEALTLVQKAYSSLLKNTSCFACQRYCVPYPKISSEFQILRSYLGLGSVDSLKLITVPRQWFFPLNIQFAMSGDEKQKNLYFFHPVTGIKHTLYFQNSKMIEVPTEPNGTRSFYVVQACYEIEPVLPEGETLQFGCSTQYTEPPGKFGPTFASGIGIIGGTDGPTAHTISAGVHGHPIHSCFSVPSFEKKNACHFVLEGINTKHSDSEEYNF